MLRIAVVLPIVVALLTAPDVGAQAPASPATSRDSAASRRGRLLGVFDERTGDPLADAVVSDALTGDHTQTSATGTVSLWFVKAKGSVVEVRKLGYEPWASVIDPADTTPITVLLKPVVALAPVVTTAKHDMVKDPGLRSGIDARCSETHITCFHEKQLAEYASRTIGDFIARADGVEQPGNRMHSTTGGLCTPTYLVDGMLWDTRNLGLPIDGPNRPPSGKVPYTTTNVAAIEVYDATAARPMRFSANSQCGVIVIWTK